ncbi:pyruvate decarboxylase, putative [Ricinus communis]|uniref:pyruvate decarboxylase n=1 Tax=Ricinus communis TaxID=3988 RepID=B9RLM6_RICCO|nr:pyruvate decarboxylase, putative [Ricinus communis]
MENNGTTKLNSSSNGHYTSASKPISAPTLGYHLARRLVEVGVSDIFSVPGDTTLTLFDYFIAEPGLNLVGCCNELNAGYAADGHARARGVGACAVTFTVGGLSILNAIAGAYSEDLPVICIVGSPNSNDYYGSKRILHHTIGLPDFSQELRCFQAVTCHQAIINDLNNAQEQIDKAITTCLQESKPVYISISCNLVAIPHPSFINKPIPLVFTAKMSNQMALEVAVEAAAEILNKAVKPVLVAGPKLRAAKACNAFIPFDASLLGGPIFDDLSSLGYSLLFNKKKAIIAEPDRIIIPEMPVLGPIILKDFLKRLAKRLDHNKTSYQNYKRIYVAEEVLPNLDPEEALKVNVMFKHIQKMLLGDMVVVAEVGDSWFHCQKLKLPQGCGYESQMLYASIGWSVGATLGYAQAEPDKRVIAFIGDGSFQMSPQDVSTMLRCGHKSIIFLINNGGYTIEAEIHDGPYNIINNWNYTELVNAMDNAVGRCWTVGCGEELIRAMETAMVDKKECLCFIEVIVHRDDTSKELLQFVCRLASANSRPPYLQMSYGN